MMDAKVESRDEKLAGNIEDVSMVSKPFPQAKKLFFICCKTRLDTI